MIPRLLHTVWVGDNSKAPEKTIETWRAMNPNWHVMVWRNEDLAKGTWRNRRWIEHFWPWELCGVADVMRWQILEDMGGFAVDADAPCLKPLDEWIFDVSAFACWESEKARPGLVNNGFVACEPGDKLVELINDTLETWEPPAGLRAWQTTGPTMLTKAWAKAGAHWTIWPSHLFLPRHFSGVAYTGRGPVYAEQKWGSTVGYGGLD